MLLNGDGDDADDAAEEMVDTIAEDDTAGCVVVVAVAVVFVVLVDDLVVDMAASERIACDCWHAAPACVKQVPVVGSFRSASNIRRFV